MQDGRQADILNGVPTVGERLATLEQIARDNRSRIEELIDLMNGGGDTPYDRSVRGRLHQLEATVAGFVLRRSAGLGMLRNWQSATLIVCAVGTAAAAWYAALQH